jgi:hypothetical protein
MRTAQIWGQWAGIFAVVCFLHTATLVQAKDDPLKPRKPIEPTAEWGANTSISEDDKVLAPADLHIGDEKEWAKLWASWRGRQTKNPPQVNFKEQLVIVATSRHDISGLSLNLDDKGNLTVRVAKTVEDTFGKGSGEGWHYRLAVIPREGIKTIDGRSVKSADPATARPADSTLEEFATRLKKLEEANAELRATVERLQKEIEQLKKK